MQMQIIHPKKTASLDIAKVLKFYFVIIKKVPKIAIEIQTICFNVGSFLFDFFKKGTGTGWVINQIKGILGKN